jgi:membrane-bound lytic murein transglycosylase B
LTLVLAISLLASGTPQAQQSADSARPAFSEWLQRFRAEAQASGISAATLDRAFDGLEPHLVIIERDRTQRELTLTVRQYVKQRVTRSVIRTARLAKRRHATLLARIQKKYGVPPEVVVAVWGLESNFGRFSGTRPTIQALSTLAWEGRRGQLFHGELLAALGILDRGEVNLARLKGSWAGAMGQVQFLPSSYVRFAQDFDGDGRKDIWRSQPDVFASIANYLRESGWVPGRRWGVPVKLPTPAPPALDSLRQPRTEGCSAARDLSAPAAVREWTKARVRLNRTLPGATSASLVSLGPASFLVTSNYEAILAYNCAHSYAMSVVELSDAIGSAGRAASSPSPRKARSQKTRKK